MGILKQSAKIPEQEVKIQPSVGVSHEDAFESFIESARRSEAQLAAEDKAEKEAKIEAAKAVEAKILEEDPWAKSVAETMGKLSLDDLIFKNYTETEMEVIPGYLWVHFKSLANDKLNSLMIEAISDTSGESIIAYESHYAMLILVESVQSIRAKDEDMPVPRIRDEKYSYLQALNSNLVRSIIDKYNIFDSAVTRLIQDGPTRSIVGELKK